MTAAAWRWLWRAQTPDPADVPEVVHDGDTVTLQLDRGLDGTQTHVRLRLNSVKAPELNEPGGEDCRAEADRWLQQHGGGRWPLEVETYRTSTDYYSKTTLERYVADVRSATTGESLNEHMTAYITAHGYGGGIGA